ncbi:MAG: malectin domain-containing carbohydrate-binding protein [bacterium]|nr:malectin domain-containing carbohydrate-binding protein [bacterium]
MARLFKRLSALSLILIAFIILVKFPSLSSARNTQPDGLNQITAQNAAIAATPSELIFSTLKGTNSANQVVTIRNNGTSTLTISAISITGTHASAFRTINRPAVPWNIPAGQSGNLTLRFNPSTNQVGALNAAVRLTTNAPGASTFQIGLYGLSANGYGGNNEPTLHNVVRTLGYPINVGGTNLILGTTPNLIGEEVRAPLFQRASAAPVGIVPVARYSPSLRLPFGYYLPNGTIDPTRVEVAAMQVGTAQGQMLNPPIEPGGGNNFDPGTVPFGIYVFGLEDRLTYTEDALNAGGPTIHAVRVYPLRNRSNQPIPNTYLVCFEDASNGDYQDYVFLVSNVVPYIPPTLTATPTFTPTFTPTSTPLPPVGGNAIYRIDAGGDGFTASDGTIWAADQLFVDGRASLLEGEIGTTDDDVLYHTTRSSTEDLGGFQYAFPVQPGIYSLRLYFAENYFVGGAGRGPVGVGERIFDVMAENTLLLDEYDITAAVGILTPDIRTFNNLEITDGTINLNFTASTNRPLIAGIEIFQISIYTPTATPVTPTAVPTTPVATTPVPTTAVPATVVPTLGSPPRTSLTYVMPIAQAGADQLHYAPAGSFIYFVLDGTQSFDPDGAINTFIWSENGVDLAAGPTLTLVRGAGVYVFTLTVIDNDGHHIEDTVTITILNR